MREHMHIFKDADGTSAFVIYGPDDKPTGKRITYLQAERNGQQFTFGFDPDAAHALMIAMGDFERYLELNGGKIVPDA